MRYGSTTVAAHTTQTTITVIVDHPEIVLFVRFDNHHAISPDTKSTVTYMLHLISTYTIKIASRIMINYDKIIAGGLIFIKWNLHDDIFKYKVKLSNHKRDVVKIT